MLHRFINKFNSKASQDGYVPAAWKRAIKSFLLILVILLGLGTIVATGGGGGGGTTGGTGGAISGSGQ